MRLLDIAAMSLANMRGRKLRSWLTVLGIVIAVASIIILLSLAYGVEQQVSSRLNQLGNDVIQITPGNSQASRGGGGGVAIRGMGGGDQPGGGFGGGFAGGGEFRFGGNEGQLTFTDAERLKIVEGVLAVDPRLTGRLRSMFKGYNATLSIIGVDPSGFKAINTAPMYQGKMLNENDKYSVVLGYNIYARTFGGLPMINRQIKIGDSYYTVIGIINSSSGSFITSDSAVYMNIDIAKRVLNESTNLNQIYIKVRPGQNTDTVAARLENKLVELHRVTAAREDFTITTASFIQSTASAVTATLTLFLAGIAAISLLVGAIGVANTMFMSVLERTREIGVLKALGMKDAEITAEFLIEAGLIGAAGGIFGILLSLGAIFVLSLFNVAAIATPELLLGSLLFSSIIGVVSGVLPARNAAHLQPVEALRYE
ncbi:MAG: ABC transporter permease [Candidatus Micrarchaeota archaeon]